jgi:site-specific DNA-methyltransferase (adenine-specific)
VYFADHEGTHGWRSDLEAAGLEYVRTLRVGQARRHALSSRATDPRAVHECLVIAHQTRKGKPVKKRWNGGGKQGVYWHAIAPDQGRCHPAQKPLGLMRELVADFSEPDEFVCDPYAGSATTGIACAQLGRHFLGWERDAAMAALAQRRLGSAGGPGPGPDRDVRLSDGVSDWA